MVVKPVGVNEFNSGCDESHLNCTSFLNKTAPTFTYMVTLTSIMLIICGRQHVEILN